jgi:Ca2+-binding EF-hand superfamily protein
MKKLPCIIVLLGSVTWLVPAVAAAQPGPKARIFAKYDTNKNGLIDGDEVAVVRKAYAAEPKGEFATYDVNHDGKLDDAEIAAIKPPGQGGKKGGGKKASEGETKPDAK